MSCWTTTEKCPLPVEVNLSGGLSQAVISPHYHTWLTRTDSRLKVRVPHLTGFGQNFRTDNGQIGVYSHTDDGDSFHWSVNDVRIDGGWFDVTHVPVIDPSQPQVSIPKRINYYLVDGKGCEMMEIENDDENQILIRPIEEVSAAYIAQDGSYVPSEYKAIPWTVGPGHDFFTYRHDTLGGTVKRPISGQVEYKVGDRWGKVQGSTYGRGFSLRGQGVDGNVTTWNDFSRNEQPLTLFKTTTSVIEVPQGYTGEAEYEGGEITCTGFFLPHAPA